MGGATRKTKSKNKRVELLLLTDNINSSSPIRELKETLQEINYNN